MSETFVVNLSYKGKSATVDDISYDTTAAQLLQKARASLQVEDDTILRLIFKGKTVAQDILENDSDNVNNNDHPAFDEGTKIPKGGAKVIVMGSSVTGIQKTKSLRSDPLMRGFDDEKSKSTAATSSMSTYWGPMHGIQDKQYKFCRFQECTDASFGSRPGATTPHAFQARKLLEQLATDPGIIAILKSRELVVGTLGEMDPIDDRLMQKKQQEGACLLGYNTNHGLRIDVKLRTDDLSSFRPYNELVSTLVHEISHNWVGEHDVLFWTNYAQMRVEYLWKHACLGGLFVSGMRTADLAGIKEMIVPNAHDRSNTPNKDQIMNNICQSVLAETAKEMAQHHLPVQLVAPAVLTFSRELIAETKDDENKDAGGQRLGSSQNNDTNEGATSTRERALAAAEKRAREAKDKSS